MFGEEVSESPRQPSPWEALHSTTPELKPTVRRSSSSLSRSHRSDSSFELLLDSRSVSLSPEVDTVGHIEYKLKLPVATPERLQKLVTQLKWRLLEGGGECYYEIGVRDDGAILGLLAEELDESLETLRKMAAALGARCEVVREIQLVKAEEGEEDDDDDEGPAPDNPLLAKSRHHRCIAEPSLDPTPEVSDSESESITAALGELALRIADSSDEETENPTTEISMSSSTKAALDEMSTSIIDPLTSPNHLVTQDSVSTSAEPADVSSTVVKMPWTPQQIERRRKKQARRHISRLRRAAGLAPPLPSPVAAIAKSKVSTRRQNAPSLTGGTRYAAEVLIALEEGGPAFLSFETAFTL